MKAKDPLHGCLIKCSDMCSKKKHTQILFDTVDIFWKPRAVRFLKKKSRPIVMILLFWYHVS